MDLYGGITDKIAWFYNQHKINGRVPRGKGGPITLDHEHYDRYVKYMELYWEEMDKHLKACKPFRLPYDLGVFELIRYKVSAVRGRSTIIDWGATMRHRKENPGSKKIIPSNRFNTREATFQYTDNYKFLLRHITFVPYVAWMSKLKWIVKGKNHKLVADDQPPLKRKSYFFKNYFMFLYKFRASKGTKKSIREWLIERPSRIYEIRESK